MHTRTTTKGATPMARDTRTATDAYIEHHGATVALLDRLTEAVTNHDVPGADPESVSWGHVGSLAHWHQRAPGHRRLDVRRGRARGLSDEGQGSVDSIDLGATSQIEVIRGPSSSLYGNASGGVISLTSEGGGTSRTRRFAWRPAATASRRRRSRPAARRSG